mmetsp:Transcript_55170/g.176814  ORF Transcript_55170/g.176814 Transcript_55170/m.176814 type:complete len:245 (+) Transcript_55170:630-1364(+)
MVSHAAFPSEPMFSAGSTMKIRVAKSSVRTSRGKRRMGIASKTSMKALVSKCTFSQRRSSFSSRTTGRKQSRATRGKAYAPTEASSTKPTDARRARANAAARSIILKGLRKNNSGAGLTQSRRSVSRAKSESKVVSIAAAHSADISVCSVICTRDTKTEASTSSGMSREYHSASRLESLSSRKMWIRSARTLSGRPCEERRCGFRPASLPLAELMEFVDFIMLFAQLLGNGRPSLESSMALTVL